VVFQTEVATIEAGITGAPATVARNCPKPLVEPAANDVIIGTKFYPKPKIVFAEITVYTFAAVLNIE
jgi:hypothetical protein